MRSDSRTGRGSRNGTPSRQAEPETPSQESRLRCIHLHGLAFSTLSDMKNVSISLG